ncbi:S-adenosyl-L-methionine-dependent methyltransferase [Echria macrotheca]|uniref:S-adenosyl-L-methionine-dependent methyltransferase n=1 Tax=Echria macrotheca TaxID=438768 RepID=A0AAJ0BJI2_9PEZI|nr:S-adenosyl-L-methionine-dependent methyltransferase [Echria macrotheca]
MASDQNKAYFNDQAASYDSKHEKTIEHIIEEIRSRLDFIGVDWVDDDDDDASDGDAGGADEKTPRKTVRLLDYACGTGLVSRALAPHTTQCIGIDLAENMVAAYNSRAKNQGLTPEEMHAYQGNLCSPSDPSPSHLSGREFWGFDIAAVGLGFHHFDDPALAARRLVERLRVGGVLLVLDFLPHEKMETSEPAAHTITRHGFSEDEIRKIFEDAGAAENFGLEDVAVVFNRGREGKPDMKRRLFIARGTKSA